jgi:hypothetical protein
VSSTNEELEVSAQHWEKLADDEERWAHYEEVELKERHGKVHEVHRHKARVYRDAAKANRLQIETGRPHCVCCLKPMGDAPPYWRR